MSSMIRDLKLRDVMKKATFRASMNKVVSESKYQHFLRKVEKRKTQKELSIVIREMKDK
jgi:hypothetical protein